MKLFLLVCILIIRSNLIYCNEMNIDSLFRAKQYNYIVNSFKNESIKINSTNCQYIIYSLSMIDSNSEAYSLLLKYTINGELRRIYSLLFNSCYLNESKFTKLNLHLSIVDSILIERLASTNKNKDMVKEYYYYLKFDQSIRNDLDYYTEPKKINVLEKIITTYMNQIDFQNGLYLQQLIEKNGFPMRKQIGFLLEDIVTSFEHLPAEQMNYYLPFVKKSTCSGEVDIHEYALLKCRYYDIVGKINRNNYQIEYDFYLNQFLNENCE